ncbi:MAG: SDR family NAD(P)-dependent oxidoreductase [Thermodesulfobacteriota bacterium]|nr:SDR family NAD(P)-dependent oxidoreductase [Thermodesulfobacteriota bacterium]
MTSLKDKIAVITGASSGIGKAIALDLAAKGVKTCLLGRKLETLEEVAVVARKTTPQVLCYQIDLTVDQDIRKIADCLYREFSCVDLLIHSAGVISFGHLESASVEDFDRQYKINVRAPYALTQALLPMLRSRRGQIVFINSSACQNAGPNVGQYSATKFALKAIADSLRQEVNADGLRVLSVYPGRTASPMQAAIFKMEGRDYRPELLMQPEDVAAIAIKALSLPRSIEVTEINARPLIKSY